jgi:hypothetical protein
MRGVMAVITTRPTLPCSGDDWRTPPQQTRRRGSTVLRLVVCADESRRAPLRGSSAATGTQLRRRSPRAQLRLGTWPPRRVSPLGLSLSQCPPPCRGRPELAAIGTYQSSDGSGASIRAPTRRHDMIASADRPDMIEAADTKEPMEKIEPADPIEPPDRTDPIEPTERTELRDPTLRNESFDLYGPARAVVVCHEPILTPPTHIGSRPRLDTSPTRRQCQADRSCAHDRLRPSHHRTAARPPRAVRQSPNPEDQRAAIPRFGSTAQPQHEKRGRQCSYIRNA